MVTVECEDKESTVSKIVMDLIVPQMGEGLQEVKIVRFLKKVGDWINEDEIVYEMETDKTTVEVESPYSGRLLKLLVEEGDKLPVGASLGQLEVKNGSILRQRLAQKHPLEDMILNTRESTEKILAVKRNVRNTPPRTRTYCKEKNISEEEMLKIPISSKKLMPADVDNYLEGARKNISESVVEDKKLDYHDFSLSLQQQLLNQRFKRSQSTVVPATVVRTISIDQLRAAMRWLISNRKMAAESQGFISEFQIFAYIVSKACSELPKFRSMLISPTKVREHKHVNLGIALETESEDLVTSVILEADKLEFEDFIVKFQHQTQLAFTEETQVEQAPHILLSYMGQSGILSGAPILVEPAVAIIFLGSNYCDAGKIVANLSLTFEHRLINGLMAAKFLQRIADIVEELADLSVKKKVDAQKENSADDKLQKGFDLGGFQYWLLQKLGSLLDKNENDINREESFGLQGMDSLKAVALANCLTEYFGEMISPTVIWHHPTYISLLKYFRKRFNIENDEEEHKKEAIDLEYLVVELESLPSDILEKLLEEVKNDE